MANRVKPAINRNPFWNGALYILLHLSAFHIGLIQHIIISWWFNRYNELLVYHGVSKFTLMLYCFYLLVACFLSVRNRHDATHREYHIHIWYTDGIWWKSYAQRAHPVNYTPRVNKNMSIMRTGEVLKENNTVSIFSSLLLSGSFFCRGFRLSNEAPFIKWQPVYSSRNSCLRSSNDHFPILLISSNRLGIMSYLRAIS